MLFISCSIFAQKINKPYSYQLQTEIWMTHFRTLNSEVDKINAIKKQIYNDTLFYDTTKRIFLDNPRDPTRHRCKVGFYLKYLDKYIVKVDLQENPKLTKLMNNINLKNIESIKILEFNEASLYFGEESICGVICIAINKKLYKKVKKNVVVFKN